MNDETETMPTGQQQIFWRVVIHTPSTPVTTPTISKGSAVTSEPHLQHDEHAACRERIVITRPGRLEGTAVARQEVLIAVPVREHPAVIEQVRALDPQSRRRSRGKRQEASQGDSDVRVEPEEARG